MEYAQAWAATCFYHFNVLKQLIQEAVDMGVHPSNVYFHEHNGDRIYGTQCNPQDFKVLFNPNFTPDGGDVMGKALTKAAKRSGSSKISMSLLDGSEKPTPLFLS
jgi:hypothetical protein